jgi:hypothetical protein
MTMPEEQVQPSTTETPAAAAPEVETPAAAEQPEPKGDDAALAAMEKGIEESSPEPAPTPATDAAKKPDAAKPDQPAADAKPTPAAAPTPEKPEPDAAVEAEIKALRLKEKGAERFRAMAGEIKAFAPIKEALDKAGIKDAATFQQAMPQLIQRSKDFEDLVGMVSETGATPEMYTGMLDYMKDAVAGVNGDPEAAQRAYDRTLKELAVWSKLLGKEIPGVVDPLEAHADLKAAVESGDITRELALKTAQDRNASTLYRGRIARDEQSATLQQAQTAARDALNALEVKLKGADADYDRKRSFFLPMVRLIVQKLPPEQWAASAEQAYAQIPALPAPAAAPASRPTPGPVRGGARMTVVQTPKDPMEALEMGIAAAGGG